MDLRLGQRVVSVNEHHSSPSITLSSGATLSVDLIIGADGIKSTIRKQVLPSLGQPIATGDAAYRFTVPTSEMLKDDELRPMVDDPKVFCWMGPDRHIVSYCIRAKEEYNVVMIHPDNGAVESWTKEGDLEDMRRQFVGWESRVQKLMALAKSTVIGKVMIHPPLDTWCVYPYLRLKSY
ncbi:hypothetical protein ONZ45_g18525 [Pleurotus djamor]|nr:hypothetical protein ONZ45_g18525 [Pleurotus djamor]